MAKQFKDGLDDFINNGFNPQDITNGPEEGGGAGEPIEVTELPDRSNVPQVGATLHVEDTPENELYGTISSGTYMELPDMNALGDVLPPMGAIEDEERDVTVYENAELNAGALLYYDSSYSMGTYSSNVVDYLNNPEREPDESLLDDYDVVYFRTPYYNYETSGQGGSIYSSGYNFLIPIKQVVQGQEEFVDPTSEGLVISSGTIQNINIFIPVGYKREDSGIILNETTAAELSIDVDQDVAKILDIIVLGDDNGESVLPSEAYDIEYGTMSSGECIYYPQAESSGERSFNFTYNPFVALIDEIPSESGDPLNPGTYGGHGYNMTPLEIGHTYKVVRDDSTGGCWIEEGTDVDVDSVPKLTTFVQNTTREEGFGSVIYYPYSYSSGQRYYTYYEPNVNINDQSCLFFANQSETGVGYKDSWTMFPINDGTNKLSDANIISILNLAVGGNRDNLDQNGYDYESSKKAFVPLYSYNYYGYRYFPVTIEVGKAYCYSFPTNNHPDFQSMNKNYVYYVNDANGNVSYSQLPASGASVTVTIDGVTYTISRS